MITADARLAARLLALDPGLGGLAATGGPGSGKTALLELAAAAFPRVIRVPAHLETGDAAALAHRATAGTALLADGLDRLAPAARGALLAAPGALLAGGACPDRCAFWLHLPPAGDRLEVLQSGGALPPLAPLPTPPPAPPDLPEAAVAELCGAAAALGVSSLRADAYAARAALAHAALHGRAVVAEADVAAAIRLVLLPRATRAAPPPTPPPDGADGGQGRGAGPGPDPAPERVFRAEPVHMPPLLRALAEAAGAAVAARRRHPPAAGGKGRGPGIGPRGAPIRAATGLRPGPWRVAVAATLRAAMPWQALRGRAPGRPLVLRAPDLRVRLCRLPPRELVVLVADASGSMADSPVRRAKGAVAALLQEAYRRRAGVALVACRGARAQLLAAPGRDPGNAARALAALPAGGATPLASGLATALRLAQGAARRGPCRTSLVVVTDGRANQPLHPAPPGVPPAEWLAAELRRLGAQLRAAGAATLVLDPLPRGGAAALARALGAFHVALAMPSRRPGRM